MGLKYDHCLPLLRGQNPLYLSGVVGVVKDHSCTINFPYKLISSFHSAETFKGLSTLIVVVSQHLQNRKGKEDIFRG